LKGPVVVVHRERFAQVLFLYILVEVLIMMVAQQVLKLAQ
jgi:hypothetical protein